MTKVKFGGYTHNYTIKQLQEAVQAQQRLLTDMSGEFELLLDNHPLLQLGKPIMHLAQMQNWNAKIGGLMLDLRRVVTEYRPKQDESGELAAVLAEIQRRIDELEQLVKQPS